LRFKLDENMPRDAATRLSDEGYDVETVIGEGLGGEDDPPVLRAATDEGRILLTFDLDFADIRRYPPGTHAGIVVFRLKDQR
jgi:predicted nuclease of predicted toxin-antitoxin system